MKNLNQKIGIIGLGLFAQNTHFPILQELSSNYKFEIPIIIDLIENKKTIKQYLENSKIKPKQLVFISNNNRLGKNIDPLAEKALIKLIKLNQIDSLIISTEPKAHKIYSLWALKHNINILLDKPITSPTNCAHNLKQAKKIYSDYLELEKALKTSTSNFLINCQRRFHPGYQLVNQRLDQFINHYQIPITFIDLFHADGVWNMPNEFFSRENHPYKYGYGKLMHSGYHFIDLLALLIKKNLTISQKKPDKYKIIALTHQPIDFFTQLNNKDYQNLFKTNKYQTYFDPKNINQIQRMGEIDTYIIIQFYCQNKIITTASINLLQNSFSRRAWTKLPQDTYKKNGRIRHERTNIYCSHLLNIMVQSIQSYEKHKPDISIQGVGNYHNFDVNIFRNSQLIGGKPLQKINLGEQINKKSGKKNLYHNQEARKQSIINFLTNQTQSHFTTHKLTVKFLSEICQTIIKSKQTHSLATYHTF